MNIMDKLTELSEILMLLEEEPTEELLQRAQAIDYDPIVKVIFYGKMEEAVRSALLHTTIKLLKLYFEITGEDLTTDENYDNLHELFRERFGHSVVGVEKGGQLSHKYPRLRGTTEKIHFIHTHERKSDMDKRRSYIEFCASMFAKLGDMPKPLPALMSLKIDGISAVAECNEHGIAERVLKRGDTDNDKAHEIVSLKGIDFSRYIPEEITKPFGIKLEVAMSESNFEEYTKRWSAKTQRSAVTSVCNSDDVEKEKLSYLSLIPLQYQFEGEDVEKTCYLDDFSLAVDGYDYDGIKRGIASMFQRHIESGIPADGVVIRFLGEKLCEELGREDDVNNYEVAYKFPAGEEETILKDVEFSLGILGGITPVGKLKPVNIKGVRITNVSLGSIGRFKKLQLKYGQRVLIRHDVIPYLDPIEDDTVTELIPIPTDCPCCQTPLTEKGEELLCINPECEGLVRGKILNFVEKVDMGSLSVGTINDFFKAGVLHSLADIYRLHRHEVMLMGLPNYGKASVREVLEAVEAKREIKDYIFLGALGIKSVGRKLFKLIMQKYTFNEFLDLVVDEAELSTQLKKIKGIGNKYIEAIYQYFQVNKEAIEELLKEVTIVSGRTNQSGQSMTILFSKVRDKELEEKLEEDGHVIESGYKKSVDIVVVPFLKDKNGKDISSSKINEAREDGKLIIALDDFKREYDKYMKS